MNRERAFCKFVGNIYRAKETLPTTYREKRVLILNNRGMGTMTTEDALAELRRITK